MLIALPAAHLTLGDFCQFRGRARAPGSALGVLIAEDAEAVHVSHLEACAAEVDAALYECTSANSSAISAGNYPALPAAIRVESTGALIPLVKAKVWRHPDVDPLHPNP